MCWKDMDVDSCWQAAVNRCENVKLTVAKYAREQPQHDTDMDVINCLEQFDDKTCR